jgi:hypothetical protein
VEDFGAYWQKAGADRRLEGSWTWIKHGDDDIPLLFGDQLLIAMGNGAYQVTASFKGEKLDGIPSQFKTFGAGKYQFLAARAPSHGNGFIERYRIQGNVLELCQAHIDDFVSTSYPHAANIRNSGDVGDAMSIALFDSEVFTILSKIPDSEDAWDCVPAYRRMR